MTVEARAADLAERIRVASFLGSRVYLIGNGGSHANAAHIASDLLACGIRAYVIDAANLTRLANDYGWSEVFARWLRVVGEPGDLLIALSGSGTSPNILLAAEEAERLGMDVWREFGAAQGLDMQAAEERQVWLGHRVRALLEAPAAAPRTESVATARERVIQAARLVEGPEFNGLDIYQPLREALADLDRVQGCAAPATYLLEGTAPSRQADALSGVDTYDLLAGLPAPPPADG